LTPADIGYSIRLDYNPNTKGEINMPVAKTFILPANFKRKVIDLLEKECIEESEGNLKMTKLHAIEINITSRNVRATVIETV
jgi:hypothetical protein